MARFDKFGGKTVWLGVAISVMYVPARVAGSVWPPWLQPGASGAARWCNIFLDSVVWFAWFSLCWCWFSHNHVFKRL